MADWNAAQYQKFEEERTRPALDLLAHVPIDDPGEPMLPIGKSLRTLLRRGLEIRAVLAREAQLKALEFFEKVASDRVTHARDGLTSTVARPAAADPLIPSRAPGPLVL